MWRLTLLLCLTCVTGLGAQPPQQPKTEGTFIVHEWGTFLSVQGSDGVSIGGMVESEEALPGFVINRGPDGWERAQARANRTIFSKMETPVTYFYSDRTRVVGFKATMPKGLLTHWYPTVTFMKPEWKKGEKLDENVGSSLDWGKFWIDPTGTFLKQTPLPAVAADNSWQHLRQTDAAVVRFANGQKSGFETEKFLFYRGLGAFTLPLQIQSSGKDANLYLRMHNASDESLTGAFAIWVKNGTIRWAPLSNFGPKETREVVVERTLSPERPLAEGLAVVKQAVSQALVANGLYAKEASAMADHWEKSYFTNNGLRVLYILPRKQTDEHIPIEVMPKPTELVRTMVGRVEVLSPDTERYVVNAVERLHGSDTKLKAEAEQYLNGFGRLRTAVLRRVLQMNLPAETKSHAEELLQFISTTPGGKDRPSRHDFIKEAMLRGLEKDLFPREVARKLGQNNGNYVEKCQICWAVRDAMETYGKGKDDAPQTKVKPEIVTGLQSVDQGLRFEALRQLVQSYMDQHFERLQLSKQDRAYLEDELHQERKKAMQIALSINPAFKFCPSCDGTCCTKAK